MDLTEYKALDLELADGWLSVWFNEPERKNPLTADRVAELLKLTAALQEARDIRGVIFRGRGGVFCAGGDIKAFQTAFAGGADARDALMTVSAEAAEVFDAVDKLPQFTVMVIEGAAMAGGMGLACCGDYVVAQADTKFALTETKLGIVAAQIAPFVQRRLGVRMTRNLMLRAVTLLGRDAQEIGLADAVFTEEAELQATLTSLKDDIRKSGPNALAVTKKLLAEVAGLSREDQITRAAADFTDCLLSDEGREGVMSFMQKRKPSWAEVSDV